MIIKIIKYLFFGFIQGFTEPLPISSSGHLYLFRYLLNTDAFNDLNFEIILNFASLLAIVYIFKDDILRLLKSFFLYITDKEKRTNKKIKNDFKYCLLIIVGSIPAGVVGMLFKDKIESIISPLVLAVAFIITAIMLLIVRKKDGKKQDNEITYVDALIIGLFEMVALMPGISRSGACLVGALLLGLSKESAIRYSFMLYLPVSIGSFVFSLDEINSIGGDLLAPYLIGFLTSMFMTYFATYWFMDIVKKGKLAKFSIYLIVLATIIILFIR